MPVDVVLPSDGKGPPRPCKWRRTLFSRVNTVLGSHPSWMTGPATPGIGYRMQMAEIEFRIWRWARELAPIGFGRSNPVERSDKHDRQRRGFVRHAGVLFERDRQGGALDQQGLFGFAQIACDIACRWQEAQ